MKKQIAEHINSALPTVFSNLAKILKENFDKNGQQLLQDATGTAAIIVKLFGQPAIDNYFNKLTEQKLEKHGLNVYIKAGFSQANESLTAIESDLKQDYAPDSILSFLNESLKLELEQLELNKDDILVIFSPKYHPAIVSIKRHYERVLRELESPSSAIKKFTKHFNEQIEEKIIEVFGDDYQRHLKGTEKYRLQESEADFLWDMVALDQIGFQESENLPYEETFASWKKVFEFQSNKDQSDAEEKELKLIDKLIDQYFDQHPDHHLDKILFVLADFGEGKSVFLRHHAAQLAKHYFETKDGYFPVYFNLRNFSRYSSDTQLGVIADYLATEYGIKINDDYFKKHRYIFLIDSLDESGELTQSSINQVIASVQKIQNIDKTLCRQNRIVITSRPIDEGLEAHLNNHRPYVNENQEKRDIPQFIALYGFKKEQFNHWLRKTLETHLKHNAIKATGFAKEVTDQIQKGQEIDVHKQLIENKTLSASELRRPIFAYMIYQLIMNNIDFFSIGKIGVYCSFINLLTKEAKHIHDVNYQVNLKEEFEFRNLLHTIAALWMYNRQHGHQGSLYKADICRVLDGEDKEESDTAVLERYKNQGVTEIQFLSHSYFGEHDNLLHFQHQSFAEILLAEYYLKVFIKYALEEEFKVEEARTKLVLGEPTAQTIQFLIEMLTLLKETAMEGSNCNVIEKRKLLFPLMASLAKKENNKLFCYAIFYNWFNKYPCHQNQASYPQEALENWCIDEDKINRIINLAREIIESKTNYILTRAQTKSALYDHELLAIQSSLNQLPPDIDRWLALLVGNVLQNNEVEGRFFNWEIQSFEHLFNMIKNWNYAFKQPAPEWGVDLFKGINMQQNKTLINLNNQNLSEINFSHSYLNKLSFRFANISGVNFRNLRGYDYVSLTQCHTDGLQQPHWLTTCIAFLQEKFISDEMLRDFAIRAVQQILVRHCGAHSSDTTAEELTRLAIERIEAVKIGFGTTPPVRYIGKIEVQIHARVPLITFELCHEGEGEIKVGMHEMDISEMDIIRQALKNAAKGNDASKLKVEFTRYDPHNIYKLRTKRISQAFEKVLDSYN